MRFGGFGPWRPEWTLLRLPGLSMPFLAVLGRQPEEMGWGTDPERVLPYLPPGGRCEILDDVGHFVHIEAPDLVAELVLDHVGQELVMITELVHNRVTLALHQLRRGDGRPLLLLHGLGEAAPDEVPPWLTTWTGPIAALDFTGHGRSTLPLGGGYTAEILLADADIALAALGQATVLGRGLGAYIALVLAGSRPADVIGAVLADGPGLAGGATFPTSQSFFPMPPAERPPDPYALVELSRDLRPPDYAAAFARLALDRLPLDAPITVSAVYRPPWLEAVAAEPGVAQASIDEALRRYAAGLTYAGAVLVLALLAFAAMEPVTALDPPLRDARHRPAPAPQPPPPHPSTAGSSTTPTR